MPRFADQAIVLREYEWSETSQVVVLLTRDHGKVRGLAKGSKRMSPSSIQRFSGGIELLTRGEVIATTKRTAELATVTEWDQQDDHHHLRQHLKAQWLGMYAAELTAALLADLDPHPEVYTALERLLGEIGDRPQAALLAYQWRLLEAGGYRMELDTDVVTGAALPDAVRAYTFDPQRGGFMAGRDGDEFRVRAATLRLLRSVAAGDSLDNVDDAAIERANRLLGVYARTLIGRELNTMRLVLDS